MTTQYHSLAVQVPVQSAEWLATRLIELGFDAFEEREVPRARCLVIYDEELGTLEYVKRALEIEAGALRPPLELLCEIGAPDPSWSSKWTEHLEPVQLTPGLELVPAAAPAEPAAEKLYLSPAFAFGFGEHASTRLIARWLDAHCRSRPGVSVLDVGSGTGVLSFVAKRAGAGRVLGLDHSEPAVVAASDNARANRIEGVEFSATPLEQVDEKFGCVVANIEAPVLYALAPLIAKRMNPAGALALAGFIDEQEQDLVRRYAEQGVVLERAEREDEWCLLVTRKRLLRAI